MYIMHLNLEHQRYISYRKLGIAVVNMNWNHTQKREGSVLSQKIHIIVKPTCSLVERLQVGLLQAQVNMGRWKRKQSMRAAATLNLQSQQALPFEASLLVPTLLGFGPIIAKIMKKRRLIFIYFIN